MKNIGLIVLLAAIPAWAWQGFDLKSLDRFADKASDSVDVNLEGALLQLAAKFLSADDPDEARIKKLIGRIKGVHVKSFEFDKEGVYKEEDLAGLRAQLNGPGWSRLLGIKSKKDSENAEIYSQNGTGKQLGGLTILVTSPKELTVVQILGSISLDDVAELSGPLGVPEMHFEKNGKPVKPEKKEGK
jgi:hypothetical protein